MNIKQSVQKEYEEAAGFFSVSQSAISRFLECRKKARLTRAGWFSKKPSKALRYGAFFHKILEETTKEAIRIKKIPSEKFIHFTVKENFKNWERENKKQQNFNTIQKEMALDVQMVGASMKAYIEQYPSDFDGSKIWIATEKRFEVLHRGLRLIGYIDRVYMFKNKDYILETKTKSRINQDIVDIMHLDFQTFFYIHGYFLTTGSFPAGTVYDIVRKFEGKMGVKEKPEEYIERFQEDLKKRPEWYFRRINTIISKKEYDEWVKNNLDPLLIDYHIWLKSASPDYCNTTNCDGKFGSCEFLPICAMNDYSRFGKKKFDKDKQKSKHTNTIEDIIDIIDV